MLGRYYQDPDERKRYKIDYADWLDTGEGIASCVFIVVTVTSPALVVDGVQVIPDATGVQYYVSLGVAGATYKVLVRITTTGGQVKEDDFTIIVRNTP